MMNVTEADKIVLSTLHSMIFFMGLPGNILVIIAFYLSKEFRQRPSTSCLILLTIADLVTCTCAVPYYTVGLLVRKFDMTHIGVYTDLCKVTIFIITTAGIVRIFAFTTMSVDRFVAIAYPYQYNNRCTKTKVLVLGIIIWIHASLSSLPAVSINGWVIYNAKNEALCRFTSPPNSLVYTAPMVIVNFAAPTLAVLVMNCRVFIIARKQLKRVVGETERYCHLCREERSIAENSHCEGDSDKQQTPRITIHRRESNAQRQFKIPKIHIHDAGDDKGQDNNISSLPIEEIVEKKLGSRKSLKQESRSHLRDKEKCNPGKVERNQVSLNTLKDKNKKEKQRENVAAAGNSITPIRWLRRQSSVFRIGSFNSKCKHSNVNRNSRELVIAISTLFLAFAFIITWAPYVITRLIITIWKDANSPRLQTYTSATTVINSGLNPIIILLTRKEVRKILLQWLRKTTRDPYR